MQPTAYSDSCSSVQLPTVGLRKAWSAYDAAVSYLAPRTTMPASVSLTTCSSMSGSCSCGRFERSPFGSVFAETGNKSALSAHDMALEILAELRIYLIKHLPAA